MTEPWRPLSAREGTATFELREEVPASLEAALREWIFNAVYRLGDSGRRLMIRLDMELPSSYVEDHERAYADYQRTLRQRSEAIAQNVRSEESTQPGTSVVSINQAMVAASLVPVPTALPIPGRASLPTGRRVLSYSTSSMACCTCFHTNHHPSRQATQSAPW